MTDAINKIVAGLRDLLDWVIKTKDTIVVYAKVLGNVVLALVAYRAGILAATAATRIAAAVQTAYAFAMTVFSGEVTLATAAMSLFNGVMKLNPVGLIVSALTAAIGLFAAFGDEIRGISDATRKLLDERVGLNALFEQIKDVNTTTDDRRKLIAQLNEQYKQYLPYQLSEYANLGNIEQAQTAANAALLKSIELEAKRAALQEKRNAAMQAEVEVINAREKLQEAKDFAGTYQGQLAGKDEVSAGEKRIAAATRALNNKMDEAKKLADNYSKAFTALDGAGLSAPTTSAPTASTGEGSIGGETPEQKAAREAAEKDAKAAAASAAEAKRKEVQKNQDEILRILEKAREDILQASMTADERELRQLDVKQAEERSRVLANAQHTADDLKKLDDLQANERANLIEAQGDRRAKAAADAAAKVTS